MSSETLVRIGGAECPRFPEQRSSTQGQSVLRRGQKAQSMDMQLIFCNLYKIVFTKGKTEKEFFQVEMIRPLRSKEVKGGKSLFMIIRTPMGSRRKLTREMVSTSKKLSRQEILYKPYLNPTQVDWYQCTKASEKTFLKELGNITGRTFGRCPSSVAQAMEDAVNDARRLFNKNTGLC